MEQLSCVGRDGKTRRFFLEHMEDDETHVCYRVRRSNPAPSDEDFFYLELAPLRSDYRIEMITHNQSPLYKGMGIPEVLIPKIAIDLNVRVFSSLDLDDGSEQHNSNAERMWRKLVAKGLACFDSTAGRYRHPA